MERERVQAKLEALSFEADSICVCTTGGFFGIDSVLIMRQEPGFDVYYRDEYVQFEDANMNTIKIKYKNIKAIYDADKRSS